MVYKNFKKYFLIFLHLQKINIMRWVAYPASFFMNFVATLLVMMLSILFIKVNFGYIDSIAGWSYYQVLGVVGSYMIVEGIMWVLFSMLNAINVHIKDGTLDGILLKPINSQFLVSFWKGDPEDSLRIVTGIILIILAMRNTIGFDLGHFILFLMLLINGVIALYSFDIFFRSFSFWIIDGSGLWLLMERITINSQYPVDIYYNKIVRGVFTFIVPLAFVATVPAKILTNIDIDWQFTALSFVVAFVFFFGSRWFWEFSLKHYSSASS
ncbi:MAG TPA: hypothetical protein DEA43_01045 [Candidatus Moranbacteria bacterium]|nr:hypothetical protein [Candidatus Moranbacteria bacterium]HBT45456.1 hypothetical protein [Candidatus Moranbacteria bacterium]